MRGIGKVALWLAAIVSILGGGIESSLLLSVAACLAGLGFVALDLATPRWKAVSPMTVYSMSLMVTGFANAVGLSSPPSERARYFLYAAEEHLFLAAGLTLVGGVLPILAFRYITSRPPGHRVADSLPQINGGLGGTQLQVCAVVISALAIVAQLSNELPQLGTITYLFAMTPVIAVFVLARWGISFQRRAIVVSALAIALAESLRALLFSYQRMHIIVPYFAFALGILTGKRSMRVVRSPFLVPVYLAGIFFTLYFGALGTARREGGMARIALLTELQNESGRTSSGTRSGQTILSRMTTFNQLSQVGRLVDMHGTLDGATLEYLGFAFIPRFLWPSKPTIAKGGWFAGQIGQAVLRPDGTFTNAVNMTVQGELYLNFSWLGVVFGSLLFGAFLGLLWRATLFWEHRENVVGSAFGFYLFWVAAGLSADLQIIVTLVALYMIFVVIGVVLNLMPHSRRDTTPVYASSASS